MNGSDRGVGTVLEGRYRLEARLSNWGVGECWRAADTQRPRTSVTVKILPAPASRRTERMAALKLLGDRLAKLQHPGVLPLVEVNTAGAQPLVVYEAWEGVSLGEWLATVRAAGDPTQLRTVFGVADRLLAAVGAGHRQRSPGALIHGAIHHEAARVRIEMGRDPEVRVIDFGLSAEKDPSALAALVDGAPSEYGAPEHAREPALRNAATDVFAASVLVLRLLVPEAVRPRGHRSWAHFVSQKESEVHSTITALRADVDPTVWAALAQGLARRPESRPADAERLREMLRAASWGASATSSLGLDEPLEPLVPMALPSLQALAPAVPPLALAQPAYAPPQPAYAPPVAAPPAPAQPAGPPPVPRGMQLGVGSVLGANRPESASQRPRRRTAGLDGNFGEPRRPNVVSLDDAAATRSDVGFGAAEPVTSADVDPPTAMIAMPEMGASGKVSLADADRTVQSPFDAPEPTRIAALPIPAPSPVPGRSELGRWSAPPWDPGLAAAESNPATLPLADATVPVNLEAAPPQVVAALAAYAAPVNPSAWDSTSNLQPVGFQPVPAAAPLPGYAPQSSYAPPRAPADPFAMVAAAGRGDARAWDANTAPPVQSPAAPRKPPVALLVVLGVMVAVAAFLIGLAASSRSPETPAAPAPAAR